MLPLITIFIVCKDSVLCFDIGFKIDKGHEPVFIKELVIKSCKVLFLTNLKALLAYNEIYSLFDNRALLIILLGYIISLLVVLDYCI